MGESKVVVELFTSQGCSSCPPADAFFETLARDPRVIALALHVDYWDYLGWEDSFAHAAFTARQKDYARAAGERMIYTPQMVVGGVDRVVGSEPEAVMAAVAAHAAKGSSFRLTVTREGDRLVISAEAVPPVDRQVTVQVVRYTPHAEVAIERGENAGHIIAYHNIVTDWARVGEWQASAPLEMAAEAPGAGPAVVILQAAGMGEILAAAEVP
jgi:hypothetical protein